MKKILFFLLGFHFLYASWGYHLILDCKSCDKKKIDDAQVLKEFVHYLVEEIDMHPYGKPIIVYFAEHNPEAAGYSLVQLIETSAITAHFVSISGDSYIDIFSCKYFDPMKAEKVVWKFFSPLHIRIKFFKREA